MSLTDPVIIAYDGKREAYVLVRGRETFYDDEDRMMMWDTIEDARQWARENLNVDPYDAIPEGTIKKKIMEKSGQLPLGLVTKENSKDEGN